MIWLVVCCSAVAVDCFSAARCVLGGLVIVGSLGCYVCGVTVVLLVCPGRLNCA